MLEMCIENAKFKFGNDRLKEKLTVMKFVKTFFEILILTKIYFANIMLQQQQRYLSETVLLIFCFSENYIFCKWWNIFEKNDWVGKKIFF